MVNICLIYFLSPTTKQRILYKKIKEICIKTNSKVIIPQTTKEIEVLSKHKSEFIKEGIEIIVSDYDKLIIANDKFLLLEKANEGRIPVPKYYLVNSNQSFLKAVELLGFPKKKVVVKPRNFNGMRGLRVITSDEIKLDKYLSEKPEGIEINIENFIKIFKNEKWPELLATEYLSYNEYTVDVFRDKASKK